MADHASPGSTDDATLAADLATKAGELLLALRVEMAGADPKDLRHAGDNRSQALLAQLLAESRPDDAVLSEEAEDDRVRLQADRVWIIDPLDGTREYGEPPRDDWAVHVALWERGSGLTKGAVALPAQGRTLATGSTLPTRGPAPSRPRLVVSRTRAPEFVTAVAERLDGELVPMGSAGAKAMAIVQGLADVYVHAGAMHEWDTAAPAVVAAAAGLHVCRFDGSPLDFNTQDALTTELVICLPELADRVLEAVSAQL
ncbi:MAG TPA: inositol monophosphatase family protein [Frankiaceae bacterium]|jgi:3'(2'), 5'-bisphosphate nucleotidase|nr:inositol monophosphatase family protein [Frankiaceae bacterium]